MSNHHHDTEHKVDVEKTIRPEEAAVLFADLSRQIRESSTLEFSAGDRHLVLPLKSNMFLELKAKLKKGKSKLSIELEWVSDVQDAAAGPAPVKTITEPCADGTADQDADPDQ